jgi:MoxR-like ATPase
MEERQVTVDSMTYTLPPPFLVIATQNPIEMEGTYPLPEAQRDRFMARISMGYPSRENELAMIDHHGAHSPLDDLTPVTDAATVVRLTRTAAMVHVATDVKRYVLALVEASRHSGDLRLGASPRASLQLVRAARAWAALDGRDYVVPDDIQDLAVPVLAHRVIPSAEAHIAQRNTPAIIEALVRSVPVPKSADAPKARAAAGEAPVSSTAR